MPEAQIQESKKESKSVEISFGTVFKVKNEDDRLDVVVDIGEGNDFESCKIMHNKDGEEYLGIGGTGSSQDIEKIVDKWDKERVFAAFNRFYIQEGSNDYYRSKHYEFDKRESEKGSRLLEILENQ